ncbi:MAG: MAPEG family protein [Gammaproteobacteria bacterium]|nr:MAPEG family protein [Gammaproteobacteria bacterium]
MEAVAIVTGLILIQTFHFAFQVGQARVKSGVSAPAMSGDDEFMRAFRVHQNTVEQLVLFIPALWMFAHYVHELTAAGIGLLFIVTRVIYRNTYMRDPASRAKGFGVGAVLMATLILGSIVGAGLELYRG